MPSQRPDLPEGDPACMDQVEVITDYLEGVLPATEARLLKRHLETCPGCAEYLEQIRALDGSLGGLSGESIPAEMRDAVLAAFNSIRKDSNP
jgi:anti-sigma factor RsiW